MNRLADVITTKIVASSCRIYRHPEIAVFTDASPAH